MLAVLLAAAEAHPSKVPFYICGGLLVAFALAVSAVGITQETFPPTRGARTALLGLGAILVVAAMLTAVLTA